MNPNQKHILTGDFEKELLERRGGCPKCGRPRDLHKCTLGSGLIYARCEPCDLEGPGDTNLAVVLGQTMEPAANWIHPR